MTPGRTSDRTSGARRGPTTAAGLVLLLLALVLAGCQGDDESEAGASRPAPTLLQATQAKAARAATAHFTLAEGIDGGVDSRGQGQLDHRSGRFNLTNTYGTGKRAFTSEWLATRDSLYFRNQATLPKGQWYRYSKADYAVPTAQVDPMTELLTLAELADRADKIGPATVHGVRTTKYTGEMRYDKTPSGKQAKPVAEMYRAIETYRMLGVTAVPFELYLDDAGLPARLVLTVGRNPKELVTSTLRTWDFSGWGTSVDIPLPSESQTTDVSITDPIPSIAATTAQP